MIRTEVKVRFMTWSRLRIKVMVGVKVMVIFILGCCLGLSLGVG